MGAPFWLSNAAQAATGIGHLNEAIKVLETYEFEELRGTTHDPARADRRVRPDHAVELAGQPDHVQGRAGARGGLHHGAEADGGRAAQRASCSRRSSHEAGVPAGVFNLVNGDGPTVGQAIASHPGVDMVSFTGSTRAGILVAKAAADTVKRVTQELGGKSANIILDDADLATAVGGGMMGCALNSGQSCNAPTRMLVPAQLHDQAVAIAKGVAEGLTVGPPFAEGTRIGPVVSEVAVEEDPAPDPEGHRRGRDARHRRARPARRARARLLRAADGVRERAQRHDDRARGDLRPGALDPAVPRRGGGDPHRQRHAVRPRRLRVVEEPRARARASPAGCAPARST